MNRILITGGTGTIGSELIKKLADEKVKIFFQYGNNQKYAEYLSEKYGAVAVRWDAESTDEGKIEQLFPGNVDVLINCIGSHISVGNAETVNALQIEMLYKINVIAPFLFIKRVLPYMREHRRGYILNVSSICGIMTGEDNLPYILSKHALTAMTKCIAAEYRKFGIRCNEVCPNMIDSKMMRGIFREEAEKYNTPLNLYIDSIKESMGENSFLKPENVVETMIHIVSGELKNMNGQSIILE